MKNTFKLLAAIAFGAIFAASCEKPYEDLVPQFSAGDGTAITINPGEKVKVDFTLNDVRKNDVVSAEVKSDNSAYDVSASFIGAGSLSKGSIMIVAPEKITDETPFDVTVTFSDKENGRFATKKLTVKPVASALEGLNPTFKSQSVNIASGEKATVDFTLNDVRNNTVEGEVSFDAPEGYEVEVLFNSDFASGSLGIIAPSIILDDTPFNVTVNFKDGAGRTASSVITVNPKLVDGLVKIAESANTFIVAPGSIVSFPLKKGNGDEAVNADKLVLLWQDSQGLFAEVLQVKDGNAIVKFNADKEGNALVNAVDASNKIVWSWLFWVVKDTPKDVTVGDYTFMDRNIGALNLDEKSELSVGLVYQYGRKDPFPGIQFTQYALRPIYDASGTEVKIPVVYTENANNLETALMNPNTYYCNYYYSGAKHNYSWITTDATAFDVELFKSLWENGGKKSIYDPCPAGYKVAPKAAWDGVKTAATDIQELWDDSYETFDDSSIGTNAKYATGNRKKVQFRGCVYNGLRLTITGELNSNKADTFSFANCIGKPLPTAEVWMADIDPEFETKLSASYFRGTAVKVNTTGNGNNDDISAIKVQALNTGGKYGLNYALPVRCVKEK